MEERKISDTLNKFASSQTTFKPTTTPTQAQKPASAPKKEPKFLANLTDEEVIEKLKFLFPQLLPVDDLEIKKAFYIATKLHNLNPLLKECYFIPFWDKKNNKYKIEIVVSYMTYIKYALAHGLCDGFYVISKKDEEDKLYAEATVWRKGWKHPVQMRVYLNEFEKTSKEGKEEMNPWIKMPRFMLEKVALARTFRTAFVDVIGHLPYTEEEIIGKTSADETETFYVIDTTTGKIIEPHSANEEKQEEK